MTSATNASVAITGLGGMGKTTVAASVVHNARIASSYSRRLFVTCDRIISLELLLTELADTLRIPPHQRDCNLYDTILGALGETPTLLCLDNFETPWEPSETRRKIEELLIRIASVEGLALMVTMRGTQLPAQPHINWSRPLSQSLQPIDLDAAADLFDHISGKRDHYSGKLINAVDRLPLAITLLASTVLASTVLAVVLRAITHCN